MNSVRITVLKREFYPDLAEEYLSEGASAGACPLQAEGDVFLYSGGDENTWYRSGGTRILCCTDGVRPVVYKVELVRD